ncbi:hypothetical protein VP1G_11169 [Cytospora mali]|uniref:Uncharacterized protein n=1 Tax=Cytospora mali TaxID=578113 RepID=A0A194V888_CYTMA|nr:hypothetical protein VP1G_11169 [Valsa mali var. pyri (nom. inval.)]
MTIPRSRRSLPLSPTNCAAASPEPGYPPPACPAASSSVLDGFSFCSFCSAVLVAAVPPTPPPPTPDSAFEVEAVGVGVGVEVSSDLDLAGCWLCLSTWPRSRPGSITSLTRRFSSLVSGKPPSVLRSQRVRAWVVEFVGEEWKISTMKVPPVLGCRATSPREVENVERSSWAY